MCYSNLEFSAETISIQDPCDINEIKDKTSVWSITHLQWFLNFVQS